MQAVKSCGCRQSGPEKRCRGCPAGRGRPGPPRRSSSSSCPAGRAPRLRASRSCQTVPGLPLARRSGQVDAPPHDLLQIALCMRCRLIVQQRPLQSLLLQNSLWLTVRRAATHVKSIVLPAVPEGGAWPVCSSGTRCSGKRSTCFTQPQAQHVSVRRQASHHAGKPARIDHTGPRGRCGEAPGESFRHLGHHGALARLVLLVHVTTQLWCAATYWQMQVTRLARQLVMLAVLAES